MTRNDAEQLVQLRGESCIWQKEAAINAAVPLLPRSCSAVLWVDADLVWQCESWTNELRSALRHYVVVQAFSECIRLPAELGVVKSRVDFRLVVGRVLGRGSFGVLSVPLSSAILCRQPVPNQWNTNAPQHLSQFTSQKSRPFTPPGRARPARWSVSGPSPPCTD